MSTTPRVRQWIRVGFGSTRLLLLTLAVCIVVPATLVALQIHANPKLSPIDEGAHLDYVIRISKFEIPRSGQHLSSRDLRITACTGVDLKGITFPSCTAKHISATKFPGRGYQYEAQQPPPYYAVTAVLRSINEHVLGISNYLTATRVTGIIWLCFGLLFLWFAGRLFRVDPWAMLAALAIVVVAPNVIYYSSIVSNDATAVFAGGLLAFATALTLARPSRWSPWILGGAAFLAAALKTTNLIAVGALALFLLVRQLLDDPAWRSHLRDAFVTFLRSAGALLIGGGAVTLGWLAANHALNLVDPRTITVLQPLHGTPTVQFFLNEATSLLSLATGSAPTKTLNDPGQVMFIELIAGLFLTAGLAGLVARRTWSTILGLCTIVTLIVGGIGIGVSIYKSLGGDPSVVSRYGLSAVPILALCIANGAQRRWQRVGVLVIAAGMFVATAYVFAT